MDELFRTLPRGALVLDLGSGRGSVDSRPGFVVVRVDLERPPVPVPNFVQADAAHLPFQDHCFDLIISNHSLEHFENLACAMNEIGRVVKPCGALYIAVPDVTTLSDRLYRWLARGGGHVNPFSSARELAGKVAGVTGLRHVATRTLCTSFSYLSRENRRAPAPKRLLLLGGGAQTSLLLFTYVLRLCDRLFRTRLIIYGWALYFGKVCETLDLTVWTNVCVRCGAGHPSAWLLRRGMIARPFLICRMHRCPGCGTRNLFSDDRGYAHLAAT